MAQITKTFDPDEHKLVPLKLGYRSRLAMAVALRHDDQADKDALEKAWGDALTNVTDDHGCTIDASRVLGPEGWWRTDIPRPQKREDGVPTRADMRWMTTAELAILRAIEQAELWGASPALTEVVTLLGKARDRMADHVEHKQ